jgi:hypothetical protein
VSKRLRASQPCVGRTYGTCDRKHGAVAIQRDKRGILISQPTKGSKSNHSIGADQHKSFQAVTNARKPGIAAIRTNTVFKNEMSAFDLGSYAVTEESTVVDPSMASSDATQPEGSKFRTCDTTSGPPLV